jgi:hypothetical protein
MGIIRFNDEEVFGTDSQEYDILWNAARNIKGVEGAVVEIGTRRGGSAKLIIDALVSNDDSNRPMFCIDPYGNIELEITNINASIHYPGKYEVDGDPMSKEVSFKTKFDYTNDMRNRTIPSLYYYAYQRGLNFTFFCLEDHEFFKRYADGVPVYEEQKKLVNNYAFVFFDGPHTNEAVDEELKFFLERSTKGTTYVFDDIWMYDHDKFEKIIFSTHKGST